MLELNDDLELMIGERIGKVLARCGCRDRRSERMERELLLKFSESDSKLVNQLLEKTIEGTYEDCRLSYCAGVEDGIRIARKILTL